MSSTLWSPEIIATIVYRVVMVFVSLAFIWKEYRAKARHLDEEQVFGILIPSRSISAVRASTSQTTGSYPAPSFREYLKSHSENMVGSAFGLEGSTIRVPRASPNRVNGAVPAAAVAGF